MAKRRKTILREMPQEVKVNALFLDYDGTISSLKVPRFKSKVLPANMSVLRKISQLIPVAIVTTKDLSFIRRRTPFAHAWSALGGLETKIGDSVITASYPTKMKQHIKAALKYARSISGSDIIIEEKSDSKRSIVAFSVDWRNTKNIVKAREKALEISSYCEKLRLKIIKYDRQPFYDVFPRSVNKGIALLKLKEKLALSNGILYLGDSVVDNSAFAVADVGIGVIHDETSINLVCDYFVKFEEVAAFLRSLLENGFRFSPKLPMVLHRTEAVRILLKKNSDK